ncbi:MAG: hypothetical protein ACREK2_08920 [Gemmatimonadota bacterium]
MQVTAHELVLMVEGIGGEQTSVQNAEVEWPAAGRSITALDLDPDILSPLILHGGEARICHVLGSGMPTLSESPA